MAKGNLLLGTAGNSVGDVVMYRREGAQVSRVRVRKIKNPKTDAQSLQRAAFSPVAKFYSPLAVVLERSFEGLSKMRSYNKFLKTNIDLARANGWLLPKGTGFFPLPYQLSQGTLPRISYAFDDDNNVIIFSDTTYETMTTIGQLSAAFVAHGYQSGDVVTIIMCRVQDGEETTFSLSGAYPEVGQFVIDVNSEVLIKTAMPAVDIETPALTRGGIPLTGRNRVTPQGCAIIVARFENDKWRRTTQSLLVVEDIMSWVASADFHKAAIASYGPNAGDPNPLVYLDGDTLEG